MKTAIHKLLATILCTLPTVSLAYGEYEYRASIDGFVGYQHDLDLKMSTDLSPSGEKRNGRGTYLGLSLYYTSQHFVLNSFIRANTLNGDTATVESLSVTRQFTLGKTRLGITVGDVVIPFGLYETQRLYPHVLAPRSLNDSLFADVANSNIIDPTNPGIVISYEVDTITLTAAGYIPKQKNLIRIKQNFNRISIDRDGGNFEDAVVGVPVANLTPIDGVPLVGVDLRNFDAGRPETFSNSPTEITIEQVALSKASIFFGISYDNSKDLLVDLEFVASRGTTDDDSIGIKELYSYVGVEKLFDRLSVKAEYSYFKSESARISELTALGLGATYDMGDVVLLSNAVVSRGVLEGTDFSIGFIKNLGNNVFVRVLYRDVNAKLARRQFEVENKSCFASEDVECEDPLDGFILPQRQSEGAAIEDIRARGIEARIVWFF